MSGNQNPRPDLDPSQFQSADEIVRAILDDRPSIASVSPSGELYRVIENRLFRPASTGSTRLNQPGPSNLHFSELGMSGSDRELRPRYHRTHATASSRPSLPRLQSLANQDTTAPPLPPLRSIGGFRRAESLPIPARGASRYDSRVRSRLFDSFETLGRSLDNANAQLRSLLGTTDTHLAPSRGTLENNNSQLRPLFLPATESPQALHSMNSQGSTYFTNQDHLEENRRAKRRKLDSDKLFSTLRGFRYGKYGQEESGQLTMEIVSCDGGLYSHELSCSADNILKNDYSVYCTKGNRCNIVLRHQDTTVFSLSELVIKAPGPNLYSSPVREGMVFVSMVHDELFIRTAQYQIQYAQNQSASSLSGALRDQGSGNAGVDERYAVDGQMSMYFARHIARFRSRTRLRAHTSAAVHENDDGENHMDEDAGDPLQSTAQIPSEFTATPSTDFRITTECECSDEESDAENGGLRAPWSYVRRSTSTRARPGLRTPRIGALPFENDDADYGEELNWRDGQTYAVLTQRAHSTPQRTSVPHSRSQLDAQSMTLAEAQEASQIATQEAVRAVGGGLMTPLTHFNIEKEESKCSIRFDPPVSGRFILLKMWHPHLDPSGNIDIQAVVAKGFAGPRYLPSIELR